MSLTAHAQQLYEALVAAVAVALKEDLAEGQLDSDLTTHAVVPPSVWGEGCVYAKQPGVICGLEALQATYRQLDGRVRVEPKIDDGDEVDAATVLASIRGPVAPMLVGERTALNIIGHLSGIATLTRAFNRAAPGAILTDTRKTLPGLRSLQKYAVRMGGGSNHRLSLWDGVLIKDNHIVAAGSVSLAVKRARAASALPVQVECTSIEEVDQALDAGAAAILLDNQSPEELRALVAHIEERAPHVLTEASGGVTLENVAEIAATGVGRISVGALTHSAPALDVSMKLEETWEED